MGEINVYSEAKKAFSCRDPIEMAKNSGARFDINSNTFDFNYMGNPVSIKYPNGEISSSRWQLVKNDEVLILQYLSSACGVHPRNQWIPFLQLPNGSYHQMNLVTEALNPLAEDFGRQTELFRQRMTAFEADEIKMGHVAGVFDVFPLISLVVLLWEGDDEIPAKANILFDITAPLHLTTASLWILAIELSRKLRNVKSHQFNDANNTSPADNSK